MQDEGFVLWAPGRRCFQSTNVRAMTELSLSVTSNVFVFFSLFQEKLMLFGCALVSKGDLEGLH